MKKKKKKKERRKEKEERNEKKMKKERKKERKKKKKERKKERKRRRRTVNEKKNTYSFHTKSDGCFRPPGSRSLRWLLSPKLSRGQGYQNSHPGEDHYYV